MVQKQKNRGRARFKGDYLVPIKTATMVEALEKRQQQEGVSQAVMLAHMGLVPTFLSVMKGKKQASIFSMNLKRIADYLGMEQKELIRGKTEKWLVPELKASLLPSLPKSQSFEQEVSIVQGIVDLSTKIKHLPSVERNVATRLMQHLLAE